MKIECFEDILSWQKSRELCVLIYRLFENSKDFGFRNQIERASVSIMNNIAEGSCGEVRSMLYLAKDVEKISDADFIKIYTMTTEISKLLSGLIKTL